MAPMVHWPEVMLSFEKASGTLFSADGFGRFGDPVEAARRADCRVKCGIHYRSLPSLKYGVG